jgi:hypothetical protein
MKPLAIIIALAISTSIQAQTNYTGTWSLKEKQTALGPEYANALPDKLNVEQNKDSIIIESISKGQDNQETKSRVAIAQQGNENEVELTRVDTWNLSADGKQLIFNRKSIETTSENWEAKGVFEKQP